MSITYESGEVHPDPGGTGRTNDPGSKVLHRCVGSLVVGSTAAQRKNFLNSAYGLTSESGQ